MLRRREFTDLFSSKSHGRPQLLFACYYGSDLFVLSSPQPQNLDENSPPIIADYQMSFYFDSNCRISGVFNGLVCVIKDKRLSSGITETIPVICNPSTREFLPLKKVKTRRSDVRSFFCYDPVDKGFKVLSMTRSLHGGLADKDHQVLTIGTDKWRMVEYGLSGGHRSQDKELCINGVLYYQNYLSAGIDAICCFDIRSEKFSFINVNETIRSSALINYGGNLGLIWSANGHFDQRSTDLKLWVLKDVEKREWSKHNLVLPPLWKYVVGENRLSVVGATRTNEIVFETLFSSRRLFLYYLNTDKNTIVRVEIQGIERYRYDGVCIFMNHVEDVKLM